MKRASSMTYQEALNFCARLEASLGPGALAEFECAAGVPEPAPGVCSCRLHAMERANRLHGLLLSLRSDPPCEPRRQVFLDYLLTGRDGFLSVATWSPEGMVLREFWRAQGVSA